MTYVWPIWEASIISPTNSLKRGFVFRSNTFLFSFCIFFQLRRHLLLFFEWWHERKIFLWIILFILFSYENNNFWLELITFDLRHMLTLCLIWPYFSRRQTLNFKEILYNCHEFYRIKSLFFIPGFSFTNIDNSQDSRGRDLNFFIPHYHFYPLTIIEAFVCNLYVRWLTRIINRISCNYQATLLDEIYHLGEF